MPEYDVYLFDWDGTVADSTGVWVQAVQNQLAARGLTPSNREIIAGLGDWKNMLHYGLTEDQLDSFRTDARAEALQNLPNAGLFPNISEVLALLKQKGKKLAVVTALHSRIIDAMLQHHGYEAFFDVVISGDDVQKLKPHPEALLLAMQKIDRSPQERVLMLGDTDRDILAAHEADVDSLLYFPASHHAFHDLKVLKDHKPTYIISDWAEVL
jgi:HAD superfamily hydrolase (TIGR01549 family)